MTSIFIFAVLIGLSYQESTVTAPDSTNAQQPTHLSHTTHIPHMTHVPITAHTTHPWQKHTTHALHTTHAWHSTLAPHVTHGPSLHNQFVFHYDYITHKMIILSNHNCYIFTLSNEERTQIHTDATMMFLEAKLMLMIATSAKTEVKMFSLDHHLLQICGNGILHYYTFA